MLNKDGQRELAYLARVDAIKPIEGKDRVECAVVGGWTIMVRKDQFKPGDIGIYFEIDSKVPVREEFEFLAPKHYKIKTQKYGKFYSQGLLMHPNDFGWVYSVEGTGVESLIDKNGKAHCIDDESKFVTKEFGVTYAVAEDNKRKFAGSVDPYKKMTQRNHKLFRHQPFRWIMKRTWGKKFLFIFFGKKRDKRGWPEWVKKTDEERIENMEWILENKNSWIVTEKIDGTSTTFTLKKNKIGKPDFYVCSRNVVFDKPSKECYYDSNVYLEMAEKYDIERKMIHMLHLHPEWKWVTIQGETYGAGIQKNNYGLDCHKFAAFNLITSDRGRWNSEEMVNYLVKGFGIPCVPIIHRNYILPDTVEELREFVHSEKSLVHLKHKMKEGIVFRDFEGVRSFKCVDPEYLVKMHE